MLKKTSHTPSAILYLFVLVPLIFSGCAAKFGATKSLPPTTYSPASVSLLNRIKNIKIAIEPFDIRKTVVSGGHHEGIAQVRQPWIWGLSDEQKYAMYGDLKNVVRYAFIDEFSRLGITVIVPQEHHSMLTLSEEQKKLHTDDMDIKITGSVTSIRMNTYGRGLQGAFEGFGSSGNYWESEIMLSDVIVYDKNQNILWKGNINKYSKLLNCPVKLDWTMFNVISVGLQMSSPERSISAVKSSRGDYHIENITSNPVELAARLAAIDVIMTIDSKLSIGH